MRVENNSKYEFRSIHSQKIISTMNLQLDSMNANSARPQSQAPYYKLPYATYFGEDRRQMLDLIQDFEINFKPHPSIH